jgi:hypothetical protein
MMHATMARKKAPVRGSSNTPSEEYLASKYDRVHIRMPKGFKKRLEKAAEDRKESLPQWLVRHVEQDEKEK